MNVNGRMTLGEAHRLGRTALALEEAVSLFQFWKREIASGKKKEEKIQKTRRSSTS